jgi:hypothetical protein
MRYNVNLGMLATDAMTELTKAEARNDYGLYRTFLQKSAEFCRSTRSSYDRLEIDPGNLPAQAGNFLCAVMKREHERSPQASPKLETINTVEPLITAILEEERVPTPEERLKIAKALYETSAADPS